MRFCYALTCSEHMLNTLPAVNENKPYFSPIIWFLVTLPVYFLVACDTPLLQETLPTATQFGVVVKPEPTGTKPPRDTAEPTAVSPSPTPTIPPHTSTPATLTPTPTATPQFHTVQVGENLTIIADKFGTTAERIQRVNEILDGNAVFEGQELEIPEESVRDGAFDEIVAGRGILHNQILCPSSAEIEAMDFEGGTVLGHSAVCQLPIVSYQLGEGDQSLVLVGGLHGGYEWNTILLAYAFLDHLRLEPNSIPDSITVTIIPNANPDGLYAVTRRSGRFTVDDVDEDAVPGRFNGNFVDLNRNWDCEWMPNAVWRDNPVSGGSAPFSEVENQILRDFFLAGEPTAVLFYHSAVGGVFASGCGQIDPASERLTAIYSEASGYPQSGGFQQYVITGDASNWLAGRGIPAITVELTTHESIDWRMNLAGLNALMNQIVDLP